MTPRITELEPGIYEIGSFTVRDRTYLVDLRSGGSCTCPAYVHGSRRPCKHMGWARVHQEAEAARATVRTSKAYPTLKPKRSAGLDISGPSHDREAPGSPGRGAR